MVKGCIKCRIDTAANTAAVILNATKMEGSCHVCTFSFCVAQCQGMLTTQLEKFTPVSQVNLATVIAASDLIAIFDYQINFTSGSSTDGFYM